MTTVLTVPPQTAISENTITIFSQTWCPYCKRAKALLTTNFPDVQTQILECVAPFRWRQNIYSHSRLSCRLDELDEGGDIQNYLYEKTNQRSVPNIFISASALYILYSLTRSDVAFVVQQTRNTSVAVMPLSRSRKAASFRPWLRRESCPHRRRLPSHDYPYRSYCL